MNQVYTVSEFDYNIIRKYKPMKRRKGNPGTKVKKPRYIDCVCAFDIETTRIEEIEQSVMYIWQFQIDEECTVIGRTWPEYLEFLQNLIAAIPADCSIVIYVHNLSYEFVFLSGIYHFDDSEVFAMDSRKILKCTMFEGRTEYRCSYLQTNMSLKEFTYKMNVEHKKLPDFEYTERRFSWSDLTADELAYCVNDVLGLVEAIKAEMLRDTDNLYTIPATSTGYVRRDVKTAMRKTRHTVISDIVPDFELYTALREAFRGGDTHANRFFSGTILTDVKSADRSSSYPDVICNCKYPMRPFVKYPERLTADVVRHKINLQNKAVVLRCRLENVELKDRFFGCPYIPRSKCRSLVTYPDKPAFDNGRVLNAESLEITITDIDLKILDAEYNFNLIPLEMWCSTYGNLPHVLTDVVKQYYKDKTTLKGVAGMETYYMKSKNLLNSIYGMQAQDPVKISILFEDDADTELKGYFRMSDEKTPEQILEESNKKAFTAYQWGVWTTAWARYRLHEGIWMVGDDFVYCDTDSVKYIGEHDWKAYNQQRKIDSIKSGAFAADPEGITHYMGVYEEEESYNEFVTYGSKKYCGTHGSRLELTCAGVGKKTGAAELQRAGGIRAFKPGFIFKDGGGLEAVYNDRPNILKYSIDGHDIDITRNVVLRPSTYTLGLTAEYERLLHLSAAEIFKIWDIKNDEED